MTTTQIKDSLEFLSEHKSKRFDMEYLNKKQKAGRYRNERMILVCETFCINRTTFYKWAKDKNIGRQRLYMLLQMIDLDVFRFLKENMKV